jgi:hypothetical protein
LFFSPAGYFKKSANIYEFTKDMNGAISTTVHDKYGVVKPQWGDYSVCHLHIQKPWKQQSLTAGSLIILTAV